MSEVVWISGGYITRIEKQPDGCWLATRRPIKDGVGGRVIRAEGKDAHSANLRLKEKINAAR